MANRLIAGEEALIQWAKDKHIEWIIVRPTLIYGYSLDQNITQIADY